MAAIWRTERPRFPRYISDGRGRDYYIMYDNGGYWEDQFKLFKKPDYEYSKYNNHYSLFHQPAPVKFVPSGSGRENYIINSLINCLSKVFPLLYTYSLIFLSSGFVFIFSSVNNLFANFSFIFICLYL